MDGQKKEAADVKEQRNIRGTSGGSNTYKKRHGSFFLLLQASCREPEETAHVRYNDVKIDESALEPMYTHRNQ